MFPLQPPPKYDFTEQILGGGYEKIAVWPYLPLSLPYAPLQLAYIMSKRKANIGLLCRVVHFKILLSHGQRGFCSKFTGATFNMYPNLTGAEVEVLLQNVDVSVLFHRGYIHAIKLSAYLFIHC